MKNVNPMSPERTSEPKILSRRNPTAPDKTAIPDNQIPKRTANNRRPIRGS